MAPRDWEQQLRKAMEDAGLGALPLAERHRIADAVSGRLRRHGVQTSLHNWGGVLCGRAAHDGCCSVVRGRRLQRFASDAAGLQKLVELCCVYTGAKPVEGFRSELRSEGFFGPSEEAEKTFQELSAAWAGLEADFGATRLKGGFTKASYEAWLDFQKRWKEGNPDTTALSAMVAEVNVTRQNLGKPRADIRPPDVTKTTTGLKVTSFLKEAPGEIANEVSKVTGQTWRAVPLSVKLGGAAIAALGVVVAVLRVTR